jgi:hypothetical protein
MLLLPGFVFPTSLCHPILLSADFICSIDQSLGGPI